MLVIFSASFILTQYTRFLLVHCVFPGCYKLKFFYQLLLLRNRFRLILRREKHPWNTLCNSRKPFLFSKCCRFECLFCCTLYEPRYHRHHNKRPYDFEQLVFYIFYMVTLLALLLFVILFIILIYFYFFIYLFILFICRFACLFVFFLYILLLFCFITIS